MKKAYLVLMMTAAFALVFGGMVFAAGNAESADARLRNDVATLDGSASSPEDGAAVIAAIAAHFNVTVDQVNALRADNLGYGEIAILLTLAQAMPGGITTDNIDAVLQLRQGSPPKGWGEIARSLGLRPQDVAGKVETATQKSTQAIAKAREASGNGNGSGKSSGASSGAGGSAAGDASSNGQIEVEGKQNPTTK